MNNTVERYKRAEPDLQLRVIMNMILQVLGEKADGKLPLEMVAVLIAEYQKEYRNNPRRVSHVNVG